AVDRVDAATIALWEECSAVGMPRAVTISRLDHPRANFEAALADCRRAFGESVQPLYLPVRSGAAVSGLHGLLSGTVSEYQEGERQPAWRPADAGELAAAEEARSALIEAIIAESEDESLMDRYLGGEEIGLDVLFSDVETAVARGSFYPALATSSETGLGVVELLDMLRRAFPSPLERPAPQVTGLYGSPSSPLRCDPDGPLAGEIVRTSTDPFLGRVSLVRVFSGTL